MESLAGRAGDSPWSDLPVSGRAEVPPGSDLPLNRILYIPFSIFAYSSNIVIANLVPHTHTHTQTHHVHFCVYVDIEKRFIENISLCFPIFLYFSMFSFFFWT